MVAPMRSVVAQHAANRHLKNLDDVQNPVCRSFSSMTRFPVSEML